MRLAQSLPAMETIVNRRLILIAVSALGMASAAAAEPGKTPAPTAAQAQDKGRPLLLAAAEVVAPAGTASDASTGAPAAPAKKRTARVTTCRCGATPNP